MNQSPEATTYDCLLGGMQCRAEVRPSYPANVITRKLFEKLKAGRHLFFSSAANMVMTQIGSLTFHGHISAKIEANSRKVLLVNFFIQNSDEEKVFVEKCTAQQLGMLPLTP